MKNMKVIVSQHAGFCFGVDRAVKIMDNLPRTTERSTREYGNGYSELSKMEASQRHGRSPVVRGLPADAPRPVFMLHELVHNEHVVRKLEKKGILVIDSVDEADSGTLIISAHGVGPRIIEKAKEKGLNIIDTTCPKVIKVHQLAKILAKQGYYIVIFGEKDHVEVKGIAGEAEGNVSIFSSAGEVEDGFFESHKRLGIVSQTTQNVQDFQKFVEFVKSKCADVKVYDTICDSTQKRQDDVRKLAKECDVMLIIGSKESGNTRRLFEISSGINSKTYFVGDKSDLKPKYFNGAKTVGISGGASTPNWIIEEVRKEMAKY